MPGHTLEQTVEATIARHKMLEAGEKAVVAVSGGPDSVALLHVLWRMREQWSVGLTVAHLNHRLRGRNSDDDAAFVADLAGALDLPCTVGAEDVGAYCQARRLSIEAGAREVRYAFLDRVAHETGAHRIATGHTADDQAETILMRLFRGSGTSGTAGIRPARDGRIIRPLLDVTRQDIIAYLQTHRLSFRHDESNAEPHYLRNRIRHHLLPVLQRDYNPEVIHALCRFGDVLRAESEGVEYEAEQAFHRVVIHVEKNRASLAVQPWMNVPLALQRRIIRRMVEATGARPEVLTFDHIECARDLIDHGRPGQLLDLPGGVTVERRRDTVFFLRGGSEPFSVSLVMPGTTIVPGLRIETRLLDPREAPAEPSDYCGLFDADLAPSPLIVRSRRPGDRFAPIGMEGTKSLKTLFNERQIPRLDRERVPLLVSESHILWVIGHRLSRVGRVTPRTQRVLMVEWIPSTDH